MEDNQKVFGQESLGQPSAPTSVPGPKTQPLSSILPVQQMEQPVKKKRKWLKYLIVFLLSLIVIGGILFALLLRSTSESRSAAHEFTDILVDSNLPGRFPQAYQFFSSELMEAQAFEDFASIFVTADFSSECELQISGLETSRSTDGPSEDVITGDISCPSGDFPAEYIFIDQDGSKKLLGYDIQPAQ